MDEIQIALIRGINVGRAKRVAMADLRALFEGLGYVNVRTLLNSGNVVLAVPSAALGNLSAHVEAALVTRLGISARVIVLTAAELAIAVRENPLLRSADEPSHLLIAFLAHPADRSRLEALLEQDWTPEVLAVGTRVAYLWCPNGFRASRLLKAIDSILGDAVTTRNWATVLKLHSLVEARQSGGSQ